MRASADAFQSTCHARGGTCTAAAGGVDTDGILIYSPREGRDLCHPRLEKPLEISIHSPLKVRDRRCIGDRSCGFDFNPPAPRGARPITSPVLTGRSVFQSTRPSRGETYLPIREDNACIFQSTRPSRGETSSSGQMPPIWHFNPLAPRGARRNFERLHNFHGYFNPLAPRGARPHIILEPHTPHHFNPLAPRGARRMMR